MPFIASTTKYNRDEHRIDAKDIKTERQSHADYYCPGCGCKFRYCSESSNSRKAHFFHYEDHAPDCWFPVGTGGTSGDTEHYDWKGFSLEGLLQDVKKHNRQSEERKETLWGGTNNNAEAIGGIHRIKPTTIRQLFRICTENSDETFLCEGRRILDILCSRKTSYFYTHYCTGIKIIEAKYHSYNKEYRSLTFNYPYSSKANSPINFKVRIRTEDEELFWRLQKRLYQERNPILIFADWKYVSSRNLVVADISSKNQVVPIK